MVLAISPRGLSWPDATKSAPSNGYLVELRSNGRRGVLAVKFKNLNWPIPHPASPNQLDFLAYAKNSWDTLRSGGLRTWRTSVDESLGKFGSKTCETMNDNFLARQLFPRREINYAAKCARQRHHSHPAHRPRFTQEKDRKTGRGRGLEKIFGTVRTLKGFLIFVVFFVL